MPEKRTLERARSDKRKGKSASTQAGEFVKEEIDHIRHGKHGARSAKQAIAIGLSKARKAGVPLPPPSGAKKKAAKVHRKPSSETPQRRAKATLTALRREPTSSVSKSSLAKQAHESALRRGPKKRQASALKATVTKGRLGLRRAAQKAAQTRKMHERRAHS